MSYGVPLEKQFRQKSANTSATIPINSPRHRKTTSLKQLLAHPEDEILTDAEFARLNEYLENVPIAPFKNRPRKRGRKPSAEREKLVMIRDFNQLQRLAVPISKKVQMFIRSFVRSTNGSADPDIDLPQIKKRGRKGRSETKVKEEAELVAEWKHFKSRVSKKDFATDRGYTTREFDAVLDREYSRNYIPRNRRQ